MLNIVWGFIFIVGIIAAAWCFFAAAMTAAIAAGPNTPQMIESLRNSANRLLFGAAVCSGLVIIALICLIRGLRSKREKGEPQE